MKGTGTFFPEWQWNWFTAVDWTGIINYYCASKARIARRHTLTHSLINYASYYMATAAMEVGISNSAMRKRAKTENNANKLIWAVEISEVRRARKQAEAFWLVDIGVVMKIQEVLIPSSSSLVGWLFSCRDVVSTGVRFNLVPTVIALVMVAGGNDNSKSTPIDCDRKRR